MDGGTPELTVANELDSLLKKSASTGDTESASRLIATAARVTGGVRLARSLATFLRDNRGTPAVNTMGEDFSVRDTAPAFWAAQNAVTVADLCAAAAIRLARPPDPKKREGGLRSALKMSDEIPEHQRQWLDSLVTSSDWELLEKTRHIGAHKVRFGHIRVSLGAGPAEIETSLVIEGRNLAPTEIEEAAVRLAESCFSGFSDAVRLDLTDDGG